MSKNNTLQGNNGSSDCPWPVVFPLVGKQVWLVNGILNTAFAIPTIVFNLLIMVVLLRTPSLHKPSYIIFIALSFSDMCVGLVGNPMLACMNIALLIQNKPIYCVTVYGLNISSALFTSTSLMTTTLSSAERYLAVVLHLRYQEQITKKRTVAAIVGVWLVACTIPGLFAGLEIPDNVMGAVIISMVSFCIVVTALTYRRIRIEVQRQALSINAQLSEEDAANKASSNKINWCVLSIFSLLILCYTPFVSLWVAQFVRGWTKTMIVAHEFANTLVFFKSMLNPVVYCWRLKVIRTEVRKLFARPFFKTSNTRGGNREETKQKFISATHETSL